MSRRFDCEDGIDEAAWDHAMGAPAAAPKPRKVYAKNGEGWCYRIVLAGETVAEGWSAGPKRGAITEARARVSTWEATGAWGAP